MADSFGTTQLVAQPYLGIRASTTIDQVASVMGPLFGEIFGHISEDGSSPAGMPFAIYHSMDGKDVELECGMPVASPMPGTDRVRAAELPAGTAATATHFGPYEELGKTWSALMEWIGSEGLDVAASPWEVYLTDPGTEPDSSKWRTDIFVPVRRSGAGQSGTPLVSTDCD